MGLLEIGKLVAQHSTTPDEIQEKLNKAELEQLILRRMFNLIMWGMIILGIGVVMLVANKSFHLPNWFSVLTSFVLVGGAGVATAGVLNGVRQGARLPVATTRPQIASPVDTKSLPTNPIPTQLPSVTERTTQLIPEKDSRSDDSLDSLRRE
jgi:hypothetical protein